MKKMLMIFGAVLLLTGCTAVETFETLGLVDHEQDVVAVMAKTSLSLPDDAALSVFENGSDKLYLCDEYTIVTQVLPAGDLNSTVTTICGYAPESLTIMESVAGEAERYDWVWTSASDDGDLVCRAAVLNDGSYHYCLYAMATAASAGELAETWNSLFASFSIT